ARGAHVPDGRHKPTSLPSIQNTTNTHRKGKHPMTKSTPRRRKKSPRTTGAPRATKATSARLKELWATPEFRKKMKQRDQARIAAAKLNPTRFYRLGVPDGMRRADAEPLWCAHRFPLVALISRSTSASVRYSRVRRSAFGRRFGVTVRF